MSSLQRPTPIKIICSLSTKSDSVKSESLAEEDLYMIETLRAKAQNPMIKNFLQNDYVPECKQDFEDFFDSLE